MPLKLQGRLFLLVILSFLPLIILSTYWTNTLRNSSYSSNLVNLQTVTRIFIDKQGELIGNAKSVLTMLALNPILLDGKPSNDQPLFEKTMKSLNGLANIALVDTQGIMLSSAIPGDGIVNYSDRKWFQDVMRSKQFILGQYVIGKATNIPIIPFAYPVLGIDNRILYIIATSIDLAWISNLSKEMALPTGTTINITNPSGTLLLRYPELGKYTSMDISNENLGKAMIENKNKTIVTAGLDGIKRLYIISPLLNNNTIFGSIALGFPLEGIYKTSREALRLNIFLLAATLLLTLILMFWGLRTLVISPSRILLNAFDALANGKSEFRLNLPTRKDEISLLLSEFNRMAAELQEHRGKLETLVKARTSELEKTTVDLKRSNQELEQFAYVASHDLQEPLRMVASFSQLLEQRYKGKLDAKADQYILFVVDGVRRMQGLINDLLGYSRVGTRGKQFETIETSDVITNVLEDMERSIQESGAHITKENMPQVYADSTQLGQVFQNLISNAIKFRSEKPLLIEIRAEQKDDFWVFSVKDNGIGIDPQYFERIFVIFQRLHEREKYPGNGIGLSVIKKIIERHGGQVWLESELGKGSTFYFSIPAIQKKE